MCHSPWGFKESDITEWLNWTDNVQPCHTPLPILNQLLLQLQPLPTHVSQDTKKIIWCSNFFKNFSQFVVIHAVNGFHLFSEAEVYVFFVYLFVFFFFFWTPLLSPQSNIVHIISGSSNSFKLSLFIWKFSVHVLLMPSLKDFENNFASMWNERNYMVV